MSLTWPRCPPLSCIPVRYSVGRWGSDWFRHSITTSPCNESRDTNLIADPNSGAILTIFRGSTRGLRNILLLVPSYFVLSSFELSFSPHAPALRELISTPRRWKAPLAPSFRPSFSKALPTHLLLALFFSSLHTPSTPQLAPHLLHLLSKPKDLHLIPFCLSKYHRKHVFQNSCPRGRCWLRSCSASFQHIHLRLLYHCSVEEQHCCKPNDLVDSRRQHCRHWQLYVCSVTLPRPASDA